MRKGMAKRASSRRRFDRASLALPHVIELMLLNIRLRSRLNGSFWNNAIVVVRAGGKFFNLSPNSSWLKAG
jgi:hypothetical protein